MIKQMVICDQCNKELKRDAFVSVEIFVMSHGEEFVRHYCYDCCRKGVVLDVED